MSSKTLIANELLPVYQTTDTGEKVIDGRELHGFLNVATRFNDWINRQVSKYEFLPDVDFYSFLSKIPEGGRPVTEYILKLDMAKELCMVENNEQGRMARKYFIEVEKQYQSGQAPASPAQAQQAFPEFDQITRLMQMIRMGIRDNLFDPKTEMALREQVASIILKGMPLNTVQAPPSTKALPSSNGTTSGHSSNYKGRWYTTKEIAVIAGVTVHLISKLSTTHGLRINEYSRLQNNRGEGGTGLSWPEYSEAGKDLLVKYAADRIAAGYVPKYRQQSRNRWSASRKGSNQGRKS